jgi:hypothetical protein
VLCWFNTVERLYDKRYCVARRRQHRLERIAHYREQAAQFRQWADE